MKFIVTTPQSIDSVNETMAEFMSDSGLEYIPRRSSSLAKLAAEHGAEGVIVWETEGPILYVENEKLFFHPSMAKVRIAEYRKKGREDLLIQACQLNKGDSFLDCTLGMGADSIVASYFSETGKITGLEYQSEVAHVISWGMKLYQGNMPWLNKAIKRVEIINSDHKKFLCQQGDQSYDIVYFDPMFTKPLLRSQPISPLRKLANHDALNKDTIQEACRVARKRVVLKTLLAGLEIERLGFQKIMGSKHNPITYGVIITD
ncbi:MAG: class I SAM-dependent methyltransferase [Syntrophomonas sp.]|nr:class I SAM-dependent methyltransferase [Syntrophomonas sp.]